MLFNKFAPEIQNSKNIALLNQQLTSNNIKGIMDDNLKTPFKNSNFNLIIFSCKPRQPGVELLLGTGSTSTQRLPRRL